MRLCIETAGWDVRLLNSPVPKRRSPLSLCRQRPCLLPSDHGTFRKLQVRCLHSPRANTSSASVQSIFELGRSHHRDLPTTLSKIFSFASGSARCDVTPQLITKFGESLNSSVPKFVVLITFSTISPLTGLSAEPSQAQTVVSVTNKVTQQQALFNQDRTRKPQLFQQSDVLVDPTVAKQHCDFCKWQDYTASDVFGR